MSKWTGVKERLWHYKAVLGRGWPVIVAIWGFYGFVLFARERLSPPPGHQAWDLSLSWWLVVLLFLLVIALAEGSFRLDRGRQKDLQAIRTRLEELESRRPPLVELAIGQYGVIVRNVGGKGTFRAKLRILKRCNFVGGHDGLYVGYWETAAGPSVTLHRGYEDQVLVGGYRVGSESPITAEEITAGELALYYYMSGEGIQTISHAYSLKGGQAKPKVLVEIAITAEPELELGVLRVQCWVTPDRLMRRTGPAEC